MILTLATIQPQTNVHPHRVIHTPVIARQASLKKIVKVCKNNRDAPFFLMDFKNPNNVQISNDPPNQPNLNNKEKASMYTWITILLLAQNVKISLIFQVHLNILGIY